MASYKFWKTQRVPQFNGVVDGDEGPIQVIRPEDVPAEPESLAGECEWSTLDLDKACEVDELYHLLADHYVEDDESELRFRYSRSFLDWAWKTPGWKKEWHVAIRRSNSKELVACICGVPLTVRVRGRQLTVAAIDFLCVHRSLRTRRLTPVLIKEVTRRCYRDGVYQAIYTSGTVLPKPVSTCRYYHRSLNWLKLYEIDFTPLPPGSSIEKMLQETLLPSETIVPGLRPMRLTDLPQVHDLLCRYLSRFDLAIELSKEETRHWLMDCAESSTEQVIWTYVVEEPETGAITDFVSFLSIESSVLRHYKYKSLRAAFLNYYASDRALGEDDGGLKDRLILLVNDALILAKQAWIILLHLSNNFDVFNALTACDNPLFLTEVKFAAGNGFLHYYLFNYRTTPIAGGIDALDRLDQSTRGGVGILIP